MASGCYLTAIQLQHRLLQQRDPGPAIEFESASRSLQRVVSSSGCRKRDCGMCVSDSVERIVEKPTIELLDRFGGSTKGQQIVQGVVESRQ